MAFSALLASLFCSSTDVSWFAGGQLASFGSWVDPMVVGGVTHGGWDLWLGGDGAYEAYRVSDDSPYRYEEAGVHAGWGANLWAGLSWCSRDSGLGQTLGLESRLVHAGPDGVLWPSESSRYDATWGVRWSASSLRMEASFGPALAYESNEHLSWGFDVNPIFRIGVAKVW